MTAGDSLYSSMICVSAIVLSIRECRFQTKNVTQRSEDNKDVFSGTAHRSRSLEG